MEKYGKTAVFLGHYHCWSVPTPLACPDGHETVLTAGATTQWSWTFFDSRGQGGMGAFHTMPWGDTD